MTLRVILGLSLCVWLAACGRPGDHPGKETPMAPRRTCSDRIRALFVDGDLSAGEGLATGCTRADAEAALGTAGTPASGRLSAVFYQITEYKVAGQKWPVRVWWGHGGDVLAIEAAEPHIAGSIDDALARLGAPDAELPPRDFLSRVELVYAKRGLTLAVGSMGEARKPSELVRHLWAYAPTTAEDWTRRLGGQDLPSQPMPR